jgi:hypothetical protein
MTDQALFNMLISILGGLGMFILTAVWNKLSALERNDKELTASITKLEILVSGEYVKKSEITPQLARIFDKLDQIAHDKADKK